MSLIRVFYPTFIKIVTLLDRDNVNDVPHPVTYFDFEVMNGDPVIAFYQPLGSFIYCVKIPKDNLPPKVESIKELIDEFKAEELPAPLYYYHTEQSGRIFQ